MLDHLIKNNCRHGTPMSNKNLQEAVIRVTEDEERDAECNINNNTMDTLFKYPITVNVHRKGEKAFEQT